jgi:lysyl-tRNA synthetase, class II
MSDHVPDDTGGALRSDIISDDEYWQIINSAILDLRHTISENLKALNLKIPIDSMVNYIINTRDVRSILSSGKHNWIAFNSELSNKLRKVTDLDKHVLDNPHDQDLQIAPLKNRVNNVNNEFLAATAQRVFYNVMRVTIDLRRRNASNTGAAAPDGEQLGTESAKVTYILTNLQSDDVNSVKMDRYNKLVKLIKEHDINPWPVGFKKTISVSEFLNKFDALAADLTELALAGRLIGLRRMGKATFAELLDGGEKIQLYVQRDQVGADTYDVFKLFDIGDIVGVKGTAFTTRTGEPSVVVKSIQLLAKNIHPLPASKEKDGQIFDEFSDKDQRYRQRYVDLLVNPSTRTVFEQRSRIVSAIRRHLEGAGYLEVETPILQPIYGGAAARPFVTHHNALDMRLYLRIANELYLKRLIVGGFDRVFEFARDFRNEGMDRYHNPEFTQVECYAAYQDYQDMMRLVETLISGLAVELHGTTRVTLAGREVELAPPWRRATMMDLLKEATGEDLLELDEPALHALAGRLHVEVEPQAGWSRVVDEIFGALVEPTLIQPTFVCDYPREMSPLARRHRNNPRLVERFEAIVAGKELCNSFTELNDPIDQRQRFVEQHALIQRGDDEAHPLDEDFIHALEIGMPPTAGLGIGVDRLVMLLTGTESIRDVILFPTMRPLGGT